MAKEYTDYILMTLGSGERVYDTVHLRYHKGKLYNPDMVDFKKALPFGVGFIAQPLNGHKYLLNLDRAYRINWAPWKKLVIKKPYWKNIYRPLIELTRSKKIGLLIYQEPCTQNCPTCQYKDKDVCLDVFGKPIPQLISPMHISRIHQPSGVMKG